MPIFFCPKPQASRSWELDPDFNRKYLTFMDTAGWCTEFLHFVCSRFPVAQVCCHDASLMDRSPDPYCPIFPLRYCWSAHATLFRHPFWFLIFIFHHIPDPCVLKLFLQICLLRSRILPVSCLNVLVIVCLFTQWPVAHFPTSTWLWLFSHLPWTWSLGSVRPR